MPRGELPKRRQAEVDRRSHPDAPKGRQRSSVLTRFRNGIGAVGGFLWRRNRRRAAERYEESQQED